MARTKDEKKRTVILQTSKSLFARKGFFNTSISDIVEETGLPVGTIYTYFTNKEEIVRVIVEEGWTNLWDRLEGAFAQTNDNEKKLKTLIDQFLPELLNDLDLINILIAEAIEFTKIEEKIEKLTDLIFPVIRQMARSSELFQDYDRKTMHAALMVYFLGIMTSFKLVQNSSIGVKSTDIMKFLKLSIEDAMHIDFIS